MKIKPVKSKKNKPVPSENIKKYFAIQDGKKTEHSENPAKVASPKSAREKYINELQERISAGNKLYSVRLDFLKWYSNRLQFFCL